MNRSICLCVVLFGLLMVSAAPAQQESYPVHPDSKPRDGVPKGEIKGPFEWKSTIFPGTTRQYWVYVPTQYDPTKPTCLMVLQDGLNRAKGWSLPTVLDNLIHSKQIPVQLGVFITPGVVPAANENSQPRFNRSFEYDGMGDRYARFLIDEIIPEVSKSYNISSDPNDRAIGGSSSGGICAFTVAWERPDQFRRVVSTVGTFVGLRGGNEYPILVRKTEPKPIRIFLQDGRNDLNIYGGSWWHSNQQMQSALEYAGYDHQVVWGDGGHNQKHAKAIMPDAIRWIWRDYPKPVTVGQGKPRRSNILLSGESWQLVSEGHKFTEGPAVDDLGRVYFTDIPNSTIHMVMPDGSVKVFAKDTGNANGLMFGPDGYLYACANGSRQIVRYSSAGDREVVVNKTESNDCLLLPVGGYYTDPTNKKVWHVDQDGANRVVDRGIEFPNGLVASTDQTLLYVSDTRGRWIYSYQIQPDGSLEHKQKFGHLHLPDDNGQSGADGMTVDTQGRLYVTTKLGVQVLDQLGRVHIILSKPQNSWLSNVVFGGPKLDTLYVTCGDKVYKRKLNAKGLRSWQPPFKAPKPNL
jgi:gluconolactonase